MTLPTIPPYYDYTYAGLLQAIEDDILTLAPTWDRRVTDPLTAGIEALAGNIYSVTQRFNDAIIQASPLTATGVFLDGWGVIADVSRNNLEPDSDYRIRVINGLSALSASTTEGVEAIAKKVSSAIADAQLVFNYTANSSNVYILATESATESGSLIGTPTAALRTQVQNAFTGSNDIGIAGLNWATPAPTITRYYVTGVVNYQTGATGVEDAVRNAVYAFIDNNRLLNHTIYQSQLVAAVLRSNNAVLSFAISRLNTSVSGGAADLIAADGVAYSCNKDATDVALTFTAV